MLSTTAYFKKNLVSLLTLTALMGISDVVYGMNNSEEALPPKKSAVGKRTERPSNNEMPLRGAVNDQENGEADNYPNYSSPQKKSLISPYPPQQSPSSYKLQSSDLRFPEPELFGWNTFTEGYDLLEPFSNSQNRTLDPHEIESIQAQIRCTYPEIPTAPSNAQNNNSANSNRPLDYVEDPRANSSPPLPKKKTGKKSRKSQAADTEKKEAGVSTKARKNMRRRKNTALHLDLAKQLLDPSNNMTIPEMARHYKVDYVTVTHYIKASLNHEKIEPFIKNPQVLALYRECTSRRFNMSKFVTELSGLQINKRDALFVLARLNNTNNPAIVFEGDHWAKELLSSRATRKGDMYKLAKLLLDPDNKLTDRELKRECKVDLGTVRHYKDGLNSEKIEETAEKPEVIKKFNECTITYDPLAFISILKSNFDADHRTAQFVLEKLNIIKQSANTNEDEQEGLDLLDPSNDPVSRTDPSQIPSAKRPRTSSDIEANKGDFDFSFNPDDVDPSTQRSQRRPL